MRDRPGGVSDADVRAALADGWGIAARDVRYLPVGAGSYHWAVDDRWFVTVDRLGFASSFAPLRQALRTAVALRHLPFVVAPVDGPRVLWPLGDRHALSVFPLVRGAAGDFGPHAPAARDAVLDVLAALHGATPDVAGIAGVTDLALPGHDELLDALDSLGSPWNSGPYAVPAEALLATHRRKVRSWLDRRDRMAAGLAAGAAGWVVTHGEPHPGNVLSTGSGLRLIDWDTVRIAPPERDLWLVATDPFGSGPAGLARYAAVTGREPDPAALAFYRLSWILADIAAYTADLRRPHGDGGDAEAALTYLSANLAMP